VATNECLNHLARYRKRWSFFADAPENPGPWTQSDPGPQRDFQALDAALRRLPASQRVPIVLFHFDELSYQQIAERLSVSISKVKTDIHRGREALRAVLSAPQKDVE
jgi:RNA polymerase sigma-70 factor (ECF subfamily)